MDLSADVFRRVERPSMDLFRRYCTMESFLVFENVAFCSRLQTGFVALSVRFSDSYGGVFRRILARSTSSLRLF